MKDMNLTPRPEDAKEETPVRDEIEARMLQGVVRGSLDDVFERIMENDFDGAREELKETADHIQTLQDLGAPAPEEQPPIDI